MSTVSPEARRRGVLLLSLHQNWPHPMVRGTAERLMHAFYVEEPKGFGRDVEYLRAKGLLTVDSAKHASVVVESYTITPTGVDVCTGDLHVVGVQVDHA